MLSNCAGKNTTRGNKEGEESIQEIPRRDLDRGGRKVNHPSQSDTIREYFSDQEDYREATRLGISVEKLAAFYAARDKLRATLRRLAADLEFARDFLPI